jgi:hypothetical protein
MRDEELILDGDKWYLIPFTEGLLIYHVAERELLSSVIPYFSSESGRVLNSVWNWVKDTVKTTYL